jgi:DHA2 family integral membrane protein (MFS transporter)
VTGGLTLVTIGLAILATASIASGYGLVVTSLVILGLGMGATMAPSTEAIMGALPRERAGVGSAVSTTVRQVGGVLGVAVLGSLLSSVYGARLLDTLRGLPAGLSNAASDSVGAAVQIAGRIGGAQGQALASEARSAFIHGMDVALLAGAGVALLGALVALLFLPARASAPEADDSGTERSEVGLHVG